MKSSHETDFQPYTHEIPDNLEYVGPEAEVDSKKLKEAKQEVADAAAVASVELKEAEGRAGLSDHEKETLKKLGEELADATKTTTELLNAEASHDEFSNELSPDILFELAKQQPFRALYDHEDLFTKDELIELAKQLPLLKFIDYTKDRHYNFREGESREIIQSMTNQELNDPETSLFTLEKYIPHERLIEIAILKGVPKILDYKNLFTEDEFREIIQRMAPKDLMWYSLAQAQKYGVSSEKLKEIAILRNCSGREIWENKDYFTKKELIEIITEMSNGSLVNATTFDSDYIEFIKELIKYLPEERRRTILAERNWREGELVAIIENRDLFKISERKIKKRVKKASNHELLRANLADLNKYIPHERLVQIAKQTTIDKVFAHKNLFSKTELIELAKLRESSAVFASKDLLTRDELAEIAKEMSNENLTLTSLSTLHAYIPHERLVQIAKQKPGNKIFDHKNLFTKDELVEIIKEISDEDLRSSSLSDINEYTSHERLIEIAKQKVFSELLRNKNNLFTKDELKEIAQVMSNQALDVSLFTLQEYISRERLIEIAKDMSFNLFVSFKDLFTKDEILKITQAMPHEKLSHFDTYLLLQYKDFFTQKKFAQIFAHKDQRELLLHLEEWKLQVLPWYETYQKLKKIQPPAKEQQHDPIKKEFAPLLKNLIAQEILDPAESKDGDVLIDYVKEFGVNNMPHLAEIVIRAKRGDLLEALQSNPTLQAEIEDLLGANYFNKERKGAEIVNDIRRAKMAIQEDILKDTPNEKIKTVLGLEILNGVRRTTQWKRNLSWADIVDTTFTSLKQKPEMRLPPEYQEQTVSISTIEERKFSQEETAQLEEKKQNIYRQSADYAQKLEILARETCQNIDSSFDLVDKIKDRLIQAIDNYTTLTQEKIANIKNEKAKENMQISLQKVAEAKEKIQGLSMDPETAEKDTVHLLDELTLLKKLGKDVDSAIGESLLMLSLRHMYDTASEGIKENIRAIAEEDQNAETQIGQGAKFLTDYVEEHYFHAGQDPEHTGHSPLSKETLKRLRLLWQLKSKEIDINPLIKSNRELDQLSRHGLSKGQEKLLTFVPARGLLRVISGDIADACYTKMAQELAEGEYPGITAVAMVTNRASSQENLEGSVLFIETKTKTGQPVLVVRANNPRMGLLDKFDTDSLNGAILNYAKQTASRRGIDIVGVPLDSASSSCSNRPAVAEYYASRFKDKQKLSLVDEPETNFNGYANHNPNGRNPVVRIA